MIRGTVISYDRAKGYGFVSPEFGGEDVFIHVNDLYCDKSLLTTGCMVEFRIDESERGPKACDVTVVSPSSRYVQHGVPPVAPDVAAPAVPFSPPAVGSTSKPRIDEADDELCDVLTASEHQHEVTEALLRVEPELTNLQILAIRTQMLRIAQSHHWSDG